MTEEEQLQQLVAQLAATTEAFVAEHVLLDLLTRLLHRELRERVYQYDWYRIVPPTEEQYEEAWEKSR